MNYFFSEVKKKQHHITFAICFVQAVLTTFVSGTTFKEDRTFCALLASQRTSTSYLYVFRNAPIVSNSQYNCVINSVCAILQ